MTSPTASTQRSGWIGFRASMVASLILCGFFVPLLLRSGDSLVGGPDSSVGVGPDVAIVFAWAQFGVVGLCAWLWRRAWIPAGESAPASALVAVAVPPAVLVLSLVVQLSAPLFWDGVTTWARATLVRHGDSLLAIDERFSLFYYFVALVQSATGASVVGVRIVVYAFVLGGLGGWALMTRRWMGRDAGLIALALITASPFFFSLSHWLYLDLFLFAVGVGFLLSLQNAWRLRSWIWAVVTVVLLVAAMLIKEYALLILPLGLGLVVSESDGRSVAQSWRRTSVWWRGILLLGAACGLVCVAWLARELLRLYLGFRVWETIAADKEPPWGLSPLIIVPGHPFLTAAEQLSIARDLAREQLAHLAGGGLLGTALLGLVAPRQGRKAAYTVLVILVLGAAVWGYGLLQTTHLNNLIHCDLRLNRLMGGLLLVVLLGAAARFFRLQVSRQQGVLWIWLLVSVLFFSLVGKVTRGPQGNLVGGLDWRYLLFAHAALVALAAGALARCHAHLGGERRTSWLAPLLLAVLIVPNLVVGTDYQRQTAAFGRAQQEGVAEAKRRAAAGDSTVITGWPYYYPLVRQSDDYGVYGWREDGIFLRHVWDVDLDALDSGIVLYDAQTGAYHRRLLQDAEVAHYQHNYVFIAPLRPSVTEKSSPEICVVDLAHCTFHDIE